MLGDPIEAADQIVDELLSQVLEAFRRGDFCRAVELLIVRLAVLQVIGRLPRPH